MAVPDYNGAEIFDREATALFAIREDWESTGVKILNTSRVEIEPAMVLGGATNPFSGMASRHELDVTRTKEHERGTEQNEPDRPLPWSTLDNTNPTRS